MVEIKLPYPVFISLVVALVMSGNPKTIQDLQYFPLVEYRAVRNKKINWLLAALFDLNISPMETARFICRVYPEIVEQITYKKQTA